MPSDHDEENNLSKILICQTHEIRGYNEHMTNLIPWPGPHATRLMFILEDPLRIATQSSPITIVTINESMN